MLDNEINLKKKGASPPKNSFKKINLQTINL